MLWILFAVWAAASLSEAISKVVAESSSDPDDRKNAQIAADISKAVARVSSSLAIPFAAKVPPRRFPKA